jgi:hypothetical protein
MMLAGPALSFFVGSSAAVTPAAAGRVLDITFADFMEEVAEDGDNLLQDCALHCRPRLGIIIIGDVFLTRSIHLGLRGPTARSVIIRADQGVNRSYPKVIESGSVGELLAWC